MPLKAIDRIILIRVKIERAKKHLRDLETEILALEHTTVVISDINPEVLPHPITFLHERSDYFRNLPTLSFETVSIAGDVIHNLRTALDHLAHQLVLVGSPSTLPSRRIEFPVSDTESKYETDKFRKVEGMRPEAIQAIDRLKPYKSGNDALWRIHELDNIDKHRALFTIGRDFLFTADWFPGSYLLKTDIPDFSGVEPTVERDIRLEIDEAISGEKMRHSNALLPALHKLVDYVENLVLNFEPFLE